MVRSAPYYSKPKAANIKMPGTRRAFVTLQCGSWAHQFTPKATHKTSGDVNGYGTAGTSFEFTLSKVLGSTAVTT